MSIDEWMNKENVVNIYSGILFSLKKEVKKKWKKKRKEVNLVTSYNMEES